MLKELDIVVDVGGVYDHTTHRYDHHQPTFTDTFSPEHKTLLSSAGLIFKYANIRIRYLNFCRHFAKDIIAASLPEGHGKQDVDQTVAIVYRRLYDTFVEPFDAHDNGISAYPSDIPPRFHRGWDIFAQVNVLNPEWNEQGVDVQTRFLQAVQLVKTNFEAVLRRCIHAWLPGRAILLNALLTATNETKEDCADERILLLDQYCPWTDHLFSLERELSIKSPFLYVIYQDSTGRSWRIQAVPIAPDSFECRHPLPAAWRGLRDGELDAVANVEGCVFVHRSGFIGAHKTREGAIRMALTALNP